MKRGVFIFGFIIFYISLFGQESTVKMDVPRPDSIVPKVESAVSSPSPVVNASSDYDRIVRYNNDILVVTIKAEVAKSVHFIYPLNEVTNYLPYSQIKEIRYKNGTVKNLEEVVKKVVSKDSTGVENSWKQVMVVTTKAEVEGMNELGPVESKLEADKFNTTNDLLEKNAIFFIRKKAARLGAKKVLILSTKFDAAYGDIPVVSVKGMAYGD